MKVMIKPKKHLLYELEKSGYKLDDNGIYRGDSLSFLIKMFDLCGHIIDVEPYLNEHGVYKSLKWLWIDWWFVHVDKNGKVVRKDV